jgi:hypothetical protein
MIDPALHEFARSWAAGAPGLAEQFEALPEESKRALFYLSESYDVFINAGFPPEYAARHIEAALKAGKEGEALVRYCHHLVGLASAVQP